MICCLRTKSKFFVKLKPYFYLYITENNEKLYIDERFPKFQIRYTENSASTYKLQLRSGDDFIVTIDKSSVSFMFGVYQLLI